MIYLIGLSQNHQETDGFGYNQKEIGKFILLEWKRMYSRFQYYVYQLLRLQQARGRCCSHGANSGKSVSYKGTFLIRSINPYTHSLLIAVRYINK